MGPANPDGLQSKPDSRRITYRYGDRTSWKRGCQEGNRANYWLDGPLIHAGFSFLLLTCVVLPETGRPFQSSLFLFFPSHPPSRSIHYYSLAFFPSFPSFPSFSFILLPERACLISAFSDRPCKTQASPSLKPFSFHSLFIIASRPIVSVSAVLPHLRLFRLSLLNWSLVSFPFRSPFPLFWSYLVYPPFV